MNTLASFLEYAEAFEKTYVDDDWTRLEKYFAPDAEYHVVGGVAWTCAVKGRAQVFAAIRKFLDGFDRQCVRTIVPGSSPPVVGADSVRVAGVAAYRRGDSEELLLELELLTEYRDGLIVRISDIYPSGMEDRVRRWTERFGAGLDPSYV